MNIAQEEFCKKATACYLTGDRVIIHRGIGQTDPDVIRHYLDIGSIATVIVPTSKKARNFHLATPTEKRQNVHPVDLLDPIDYKTYLSLAIKEKPIRDIDGIQGFQESAVHKAATALRESAVLKAATALHNDKLDALQYVLPIQYKTLEQLKEKYPMPHPSPEKTFETIDFVYGEPVDTVTDENLLGFIEEMQSKIIDLESLKIKSAYVKAKIEEHKATQNKFIEILDSRVHPKDPS